jgi:hypothetical protein
MPKKLSKTGRTKFEIENLDYGFLIQAITNYETLVNESDVSDNSLFSKEFILDRVKSLKKTFEIEKEG